MSEIPEEARRLAAFIGEWEIEAKLPGIPADAPKGHVSFEWMPGEQYLVERWEVPVPEAPDGLAVIAWHPHRGTYLQHYFDSRGVARIYEMSFDGRVWKLLREQEDFSEIPFRQRYEGTFSDDGRTIDGAWEIAEEGEDWRKDFDLIYTRVG